jgi:hypothetical protein
MLPGRMPESLRATIVVLDDADDSKRVASVTRLEKGGHAHVTYLHFALLHGVDHVRARVDHLEADLYAMLLEKSFFDADEHRQMAEVVADDGIDHRQLRGRGTREPACPDQQRPRGDGGEVRVMKSPHGFPPSV